MSAVAPLRLDLLCHALGLCHARGTNEPYRNYYVAGPGNADLEALEEAGLMRRREHNGSVLPSASLLFHVTDAGTAAALEHHLATRPKVSRGSARYARWLDMSDYFDVGTFGDWLKHGCPEPTL